MEKYIWRLINSNFLNFLYILRVNTNPPYCPYSKWLKKKKKKRVEEFHVKYELIRTNKLPNHLIKNECVDFRWKGATFLLDKGRKMNKITATH